MHAKINSKNGVNNVASTKQRNRAHLVQVILVHMANGGQDHTQKKNVSFTVKIFSINSS